MKATQSEVLAAVSKSYGKYNTRPTAKQRIAVRKMQENGGIISKAMLDAGYKPQTAKVPQKLTESKGFLQALDDAGLTDDFLNDCLQEDIKGKKRNRLGELTLAYKLKGRLKDNVQAVQVNIEGIEYTVPEPRNERIQDLPR